MNEDLEENYEEEQPDSEKDLRFSLGHRDELTDDEIEYELDFEEYPDDNENVLHENDNENEFENKEFNPEKFRRVRFSQTNEIIPIDRISGPTKDVKMEKFIEGQELRNKRKSIYNLDSYKSEATVSKLKKEDQEQIDKKIRYSEALGIPGIARIDLSPLTQKIVGCVIGENVTTEYPWIYIKKELIEDNIDLHDESSDFLDIKDEIETFPDTKILIGYVPSSVDDGQFYICLTEAGRDAVIRQIESQRLDQESRVQSAVHKVAGDWIDSGSKIEVDETIVKNNRPLLEIEIQNGVVQTLMNIKFCQMEEKPKLMRRRVILSNRDVDDQRDGYVKLNPYRETFENVSKLLNDTAVQVTPTFVDNEAQTVTKCQTNAWSQHSSEYSTFDLSKLPESKSRLLNEFLKKEIEYISNEMLWNTTLDLHSNDYVNLIRSEKDRETMMTVAYKEYANYYDGKLCTDKVINDLCWHPFLTGIAVCAYTDFAKSSKFIGPWRDNEVRNVTAKSHKTLLWSFTDTLAPKLIFDSPREVSAVSICPYDGNLIIGGYSNGQIVLWHIPDLMEKLESTEVYTTAQMQHKALMKSLMSWMTGVRGSSDIEITATSALQSSQKGRITQIAWVPCYNKIGKDGKIISLPAETSPADLSCQFVTASEDGSVAFWDLNLETVFEKRKRLNIKRDKSKISKPDILLQAISPYKELDGIWHPDYVINVVHPEFARRLIITTMNIYFPKIHKEQTDYNPNDEDDILFRKCFRNVMKKPSYEMEPKIFIGSATGHCGVITWEGYNFSTGQMINRETCQWNWINIIHDGPITQAVRSPFITDLLMTVGGKIFALWKENFRRPFFWNRSEYRYTACAWGNYRPSVLVVSRSDGTIEIWNFTTKSMEASLMQNISGGVLTGIYNHELPLNPQCTAFCDYNGALRLFLSSPSISDYKEDIKWMETFISRTMKGINDFEEWQKNWSASNVEIIEEKKKLSDLENEKRIKEAAEENAREIQETSKANISPKTQAPRNFIEVAQQRWMSMELKRMQSIILEQKGLNEKELERCRAPLLKMRQEADEKKRKLRKIIQLQDKIFEDTTAFLFPKQYYEQHQTKVSSTFVPEEKPAPPTSSKLETSQEIQFNSPEEEIIYNFMEVQAEALSTMLRRPHKYAFQWRNTLSEGKARRNSMDVDLEKFNKPKKGIDDVGHSMSDLTQSIGSSVSFFSRDSEPDADY